MPANVEGLSYANAAHLRNTSVPWWGTGTSAKETQYDHWLSDDEVNAEIGFDVGVQPLYRRDDNGMYVPVDDAQETVKIAEIDDPLATFKRFTHSHIATVGHEYVPFPGRSLVEFGSQIVENWGEKWDTAGRLRGDRIIFATIRLDHLIETGALLDFDGSDWFSWLLLWTSHDGSMALGADVVRQRTVCENTFKGGISSAKSAFRIRHTADIGGRAREAARVLNLVTKGDKDFADAAHKLAESVFELEQYEDFAKALFPSGNDDSDESKKRRQVERDAVKKNWLQTPTVTDDLRFTKWGLLNATTEWAEHQRPVVKRGEASERRMLTTCFGGPVEKVRDRATALLTRR